MVERFVRDEEVDSSSLSAPTILFRSDMKLNASGVNAVISPFLWVLVSAFCYFISAGTFETLQGSLYYAMALAFTAISSVVLADRAPGPMNERGLLRKDACGKDKMLVAAYLILDSAVVPAIAGLDYRNLHDTSLGISHLCLGIALYLISFSVGFWAMAANPFYERLSRIQDDRKQYVVLKGPYAVVRHPGYLSMALKSLALPLITGSRIALMVSLAPCVICIIRAFNEDRMLSEGLEGYAQYSEKVRYKLLPWVV